MMPDARDVAEMVVLRLFAGRSFLTINEAIDLVECAITAAIDADSKTPCL